MTLPYSFLYSTRHLSMSGNGNEAPAPSMLKVCEGSGSAGADAAWAAGSAAISTAPSAIHAFLMPRPARGADIGQPSINYVPGRTLRGLYRTWGGRVPREAAPSHAERQSGSGARLSKDSFSINAINGVAKAPDAPDLYGQLGLRFVIVADSGTATEDVKKIVPQLWRAHFV